MFEKVLKKVQESKIEKSSFDEVFPSIFYVGLPKTGSKAIMHGFDNNQVAHWHNLETFERVYGINDLSTNNYDLYDFIKYGSQKYNYRPLIVEGFRDPIRRYISLFFEIVTSILNKGYENNIFLDKETIEKHKDIVLTIQNHKNFPKFSIDDQFIINLILQFIEKDLQNENKILLEKAYSNDLWIKHFNINFNKSMFNDEGYYFNQTEWCDILLYKFENIDNLNNLFIDKLNLNFNNKIINKTESKWILGKFYPIILNRLKFDRNIITKLYEPSRIYYSDTEIEKFIDNFSSN